MTKFSPKRTKDGLVKRYGPGILEDLKPFEEGNYISSVEISRKYGVSRQSVSLWIKRIFGIGILDCFQNENYKKVPNIIKGYKYEKLFYKTCNLLGLKIERYKDRSFDFVVNGKTVDVKFCKNTHKRSFFCHLSKKQNKNCEFIAFFHNIEMCFFIIPKFEYIGKKNIYLKPFIGTHKNSKNRYWEYKDRFDLLR